MTTTNIGRRRFLQGSLLAALGTTAAACGTAGSGGSGGTKTLSFFSWDNQATMGPVDTLFTKQNGIQISFSTAPPVDQYVSTLQTRLLAHHAADVFIYTAEDKQLSDAGYVKDLSNESFVDVMNVANRDFMTRDGKVWGLSIDSWAGGIMYNKGLLAKVGATGLPDSWDGFLELCGELKKAGITPYYDDVKDGNIMALWGLLGAYFETHGFPDADIFAGKTTFAETWAEPLLAYSKLYSQELSPTAVVGITGDQIVTEFSTSRVAMFGAGTWNVPTVVSSAPNLQFQTAGVPGIATGSSYWAGAASPGLAINAAAKNPDAALKFLEFMAGRDAEVAYAKSSGAITTTTTYSSPVSSGLESMAAAARSGTIYLPVVAWPRHSDQLAAFLTTQVEQMIQGKLSAAAIPATLDSQLKQLDSQ
jgi:raffinose/stachyose/melibiose transport system substrate-binding protein